MLPEKGWVLHACLITGPTNHASRVFSPGQEPLEVITIRQSFTRLTPCDRKYCLDLLEG
jgi:hypothetical protein